MQRDVGSVVQNAADWVGLILLDAGNPPDRVRKVVDFLAMRLSIVAATGEGEVGQNFIMKLIADRNLIPGDLGEVHAIGVSGGVAWRRDSRAWRPLADCRATYEQEVGAHSRQQLAPVDGQTKWAAESAAMGRLRGQAL